MSKTLLEGRLVRPLSWIVLVVLTAALTGSPSLGQDGDFEPNPDAVEWESVRWLALAQQSRAYPNPDAAATKESEMKPYSEQIVGVDLEFEMVPIPGGKFLMGSPEDEPDRNDDEGPLHAVTISPFWIGKHEVTWDEYEQWMLSLERDRRAADATVSDADVKADFSNYGSALDLVAPGVDIVSTYPHTSTLGSFARWSGTSMAAPFVSGAIAVALEAGAQVNPTFKGSDAAGEVVDALVDVSAQNPGVDLGDGRVDLLAPLQP